MRLLLPLAVLVSVLPAGVHAAGPSAFRGKTLEQWSADLKATEARVRARAATALGLGPFGGPAVAPLVEALKDDEDEVCRCVVVALGHIGHEAETAIPDLVRVMCEGSRREADLALEAIARIGPAAIPALATLVRDEKTAGARAVVHVRRMGKPALPQLLAALRDESASVRAWALSILWDLDADVAGAVPVLVPMLRDAEPEVQRLVVEVLTRLGRRAAAAAPALADTWRTDRRTDVVRVLCAMGKEALPILGAMPPEERAGFLASLAVNDRETLAYARRALGDARYELRRDAGVALSQSELPPDVLLPVLLEALAVTRDATARKGLVSAVGSVTPPCHSSILAVARHLSDTDDDVSFRAAEQLGQLGRDARLALPFAVRALKEGRVVVRQRAAALLASIGDPGAEAVLPLLGALQDQDLKVRRAAVGALADLGPDVCRVVVPGDTAESAPVLRALRARLRDPDSLVRYHAASTLHRFGDRVDAVDVALARFVLDVAGQLRRSFQMNELVLPATEMLRERGTRSRAAIELLVQAADSDNPNRSGLGLFALSGNATLSDTLIPSMRETLLARGGIAWKEPLARALLAMGERGVPALVDGLKSEESCEYVLQAIESGNKPPRALVPALLPLVEERALSTRRRAVTALGATNDSSEPVRRALATALLDAEESVREKATAAIGSLGPSARPLVGSLVEALVDRSADVRAATVLALARIGPADKAVLPALIETLTDRDRTVRRLTAEALGGLGKAGRAALPALRTACRDEDGSVRVAAALAREKLGEKEEARAVLVEVLRSSSRQGRIQAAEALWERERRREAVTVLARALRDDPSGRENVIRALQELEGAEEVVRDAVLPLLSHPEREVRAGAWRVLGKVAPRETAARLNR